MFYTVVVVVVVVVYLVAFRYPRSLLVIPGTCIHAKVGFILIIV